MVIYARQPRVYKGPMVEIKISHKHTLTSIGKAVMAIFVYPKRPPAAILDFIDSKIAPFDPPTSKTLA